MSSARHPRSLARTLAIFVLGVAAAGCYHHSFTVGAGAPGGALVHDEWRHHWLWGLVDPDSDLELRQVCPSGDATIEGEVTFLNGLVHVLTSGIYTPTTVRVRCSGTRAELDLELDADEVARIVEDPVFLLWVSHVVPEHLATAAAVQSHRTAD
jgi:hypothetical protein